MYRDDPCIVLTAEGADKIASAKTDRGGLALRHVPVEGTYVVAAIDVDRGLRLPVRIPTDFRTLNLSHSTCAGEWARSSDPDVMLSHISMRRRPGTAISFTDFRALVPSVKDPGNLTGVLITHHYDISADLRDYGATEFAGWLIERSHVRPVQIAVEPPVVGLAQLQQGWPVDELAAASVMLVGCGSIGSAAAEALAGYGIGRIELVDPDRFWWHNMIRHTLGRESVGRLKVRGLKSHLETRWPTQIFDAVPIDVVTDAHIVRARIPNCDLVVCAADGVAPRRVISHLARRASRPAVLACVLDHGAVGEVIRLRPSQRFGCLLCHRADLATRGGIDPEADQELAYGTGSTHQPMTAVPSDLRLIGQVAAKVAVATLLESKHGDHTQRLPGEQAVIGLRPAGDLAEPYANERAGEIQWRPIPSPRPDCVTCGPA